MILAKNIIHIGDHSLEFDIRVKEQIASLNNHGENFYCREEQKRNSITDRYYLSFLFFLVTKSFISLFKIKKIYTMYRKNNLKLAFFNYNTLFVYRYFFRNSIKILHLIEQNKPDLLIANDLACGLIAAYCKKKFNIAYYYDSHEFQIFRNYQNSFLKCLLVSGLEHVVVKDAIKYCVVNEKIGCYYKYLYGKKGSIVVNNFYSNQTSSKQDDFSLEKKHNIVYFGHISAGRGLDYLEYFQQLSTVDKILIYTDLNRQSQLIDELKILPKIIWNPYAENFSQLYLDRAWGFCMIEDVVLSYKFSLPNKFFQYLACDLPIITIANTYLAEIVTRFKVGIVLTKKDFEEDINIYLNGFNKIRRDFPLAKIQCIEYFSKNNYANFFEIEKVA